MNVDCKEEKFYIKIADDSFAEVNHLSKLEDKIELDTYTKLTDN